MVPRSALATNRLVDQALGASRNLARQAEEAMPRQEAPRLRKRRSQQPQTVGELQPVQTRQARVPPRLRGLQQARRAVPAELWALLRPLPYVKGNRKCAAATTFAACPTNLRCAHPQPATNNMRRIPRHDRSGRMATSISHTSP